MVVILAYIDGWSPVGNVVRIGPQLLHPLVLSLIHISEPTRPLYISYAVFCLKKAGYWC